MEGREITVHLALTSPQLQCLSWLFLKGCFLSSGTLALKVCSVFKQVKSDLDSHGSSESDNQRDNAVPAAQKRAAPSSLSDSAVEDESSDKDDVTRKVQSLSLASAGTVHTSTHE